jgi:hypothetical protein
MFPGRTTPSLRILSSKAFIRQPLSLGISIKNYIDIITQIDIIVNKT